MWNIRDDFWKQNSQSLSSQVVYSTLEKFFCHLINGADLF